MIGGSRTLSPRRSAIGRGMHSWVKRQQAKERRRLARQRLARSARRGALSVAVFIRSVFSSLWKGVAYLGHLIWQSAAWIALSTYALSAFLLKQLSIGVSWISARDPRGCARIAQGSFGRLLVGRRHDEGVDDRLVQACWRWAIPGRAARCALSRSLRSAAASISSSWVSARVRAAALASFSLLSLGSSWIAARVRALAMVSVGTASSGFAWTRAKSRDLARTSRKGAAAAGSWLVVRTSALANAIRNAAAVGSAWTAEKTRTIARASSESATAGLSWARPKGHALALASRDAAAGGSAWTAAKTRSIAQTSSGDGIKRPFLGAGQRPYACARIA